MRLGGRISAASEILSIILDNRLPASQALQQWASAHRFAGSSDRSAIGNLVYDVLRRKAELTWRMDSDLPLDLVFGAALLQLGVEPAALESMLSDDKFAPDFLSEGQQLRWQSLANSEVEPIIKANIPEWLQPNFEQVFGASWAEEGAALAMRPSLDLRVNSLKAKPEKLLQEILLAKPFNPALPNIVRVAATDTNRRHPNITHGRAYNKGWVEVQDAGSQIVSYLVNPKLGCKILDYCAGAGGKTLALAAAMQNKGQIYAYDAHMDRLAPIYARIQRAGAHNVQVIDQANKLKDLHDRMDIVLLDAPCTGTGTWRRNPDSKWRLGEEQLKKRQKEQAEILALAPQYLKTGGKIVYITCSLLPEENSEQIEQFLAHNPGFKSIDMQAHWDNLLGNSGIKALFPKHGLLLTPATSNTDGFYISILERS